MFELYSVSDICNRDSQLRYKEMELRLDLCDSERKDRTSVTVVYQRKKYQSSLVYKK